MPRFPCVRLGAGSIHTPKIQTHTLVNSGVLSSSHGAVALSGATDMSGSALSVHV